MANVGAKLKLNQELIDKVVDILLEGNYANVACECVGISEYTYYEWIKHAKRDEDAGIESIFTNFSKSIKKAEADAEKKYLETIKKASIHTWQAAAWYLERKHRQKWATRTEIEHSGEVGVKIIDDVGREEKEEKEEEV